MSKFNSFVKGAKFALKKNAPVIYLVSGGVCVVGGLVTGIMAGTKLKEKTLPIVEKRDQVRDILDNPDSYEYANAGGEELSPEEAQVAIAKNLRKELTMTYIEQAKVYFKLFAAPVGMTAGGLLMICRGHNVLNTRYLDTSAALAASIAESKQIRANIIEKYGEEAYKDLKFNIKEHKEEETVVDAKGREKKVETTVKATDGLAGYSVYAKFFDEGCTQWDKNPEYNLTFLLEAQRRFNDLLKANGVVFLNEVYDYLGIPRTKAGQIVGWRYNGDGDNVIDFGIHTSKRQVVRDFVNGYENVILLDFNVDGNVYDTL